MLRNCKSPRLRLIILYYLDELLHDLLLLLSRKLRTISNLTQIELDLLITGLLELPLLPPHDLLSLEHKPLRLPEQLLLRLVGRVALRHFLENCYGFLKPLESLLT